MKKFTCLATALLILATSLSSCEDKEQECTPTVLNENDCISILSNLVHDESASIIGKWKLEKKFQHFGQDVSTSCLDYSHCNIVYEFKPNGVLTVSGRAGQNIFPGVENHSYSIGSFPDERSLKINNTYWWHNVTSERLVFNLLPLDGGAYIFVRVTPTID